MPSSADRLRLAPKSRRALRLQRRGTAQRDARRAPGAVRVGATYDVGSVFELPHIARDEGFDRKRWQRLPLDNLYSTNKPSRTSGRTTAAMISASRARRLSLLGASASLNSAVPSAALYTPSSTRQCRC